MATLEHIGQLLPDPKNSRKHNPRNIGQIVDALHEVGAARSIVIDEDGVVLAGNGVVEAAAQAGIDGGTFDRWMARGKREPGIYREFRAAVEAAEARAEVVIVAQWRANIPDNWQAARDFLARRFPDRWGPKERLSYGQ